MSDDSQRLIPLRQFTAPRYWLTWIGLFLMWLVARLPYAFQLMLGRLLGSLAYYLARERRHVCEVNLKLCFPELSQSEHYKLVKNVLEPAALGIPVVVGPSQYNFASICSQLEEAGALRTVADETELARFLIELNGDEAEQERMGAAGEKLVRANQGALPAMMKIVQSAIG